MTIKEKIFDCLISCEIGSYTTYMAPEKTVISISNICKLIPETTRYGARKALKELIAEGTVEYASQGCPAVVSYGEYTELVCDARPPINGYTLTKKGFETDRWKQRYAEWCKSMEDWANGKM